MKIKWIPAWVLACALILFCLPAKASQDNVAAASAAYLPLSRDVSGTIEETGSCGVGLTYQVIKTGSSWGNNHYTLVISGSGRMNDYQKETAPWRHFGNANFYSIVLNEGLTHIGDYAFNYFYNVGKITLPQSLVSIGRNAFGDPGTGFCRVQQPKRLYYPSPWTYFHRGFCFLWVQKSDRTPGAPGRLDLLRCKRLWGMQRIYRYIKHSKKPFQDRDQLFL